jgi:hypothetical protein
MLDGSFVIPLTPTPDWLSPSTAVPVPELNPETAIPVPDEPWTPMPGPSPYPPDSDMLTPRTPTPPSTSVLGNAAPSTPCGPPCVTAEIPPDVSDEPWFSTVSASVSVVTKTPSGAPTCSESPSGWSFCRSSMGPATFAVTPVGPGALLPSPRCITFVES